VPQHGHLFKSLLKTDMHKKILLSILATLATGPSWAQASEPASARIQWGVSGGINQYKEPDFMQLKGPEVACMHA